MKKSVFTKKDLKTLVLKFANDVAHDEDLIHHYDGDFRNAKEWIKENI